MFRCSHCGALNRVPTDRPQAEPVCGRCKKTLSLDGAPQEVDADGFERALASATVPVLVDFWAPWCAPCRAASPIVERISKANAGKLLVLKVNTDEVPGPPTKFGIQGIPAFVVFRNGAEVARQAGMMPFERMKAWVDGATTLV